MPDNNSSYTADIISAALNVRFWSFSGTGRHQALERIAAICKTNPLAVRAVLEGCSGPMDAIFRVMEDFARKNTYFDDTMSVQDKIFEAILIRLESLAPLKKEIKAILSKRSDLLERTPEIIRLGLRVGRALRQQVRPDLGPPRALAYEAGLSGLFILTVRTWLDDESTDLSMTMKTLDQTLKRAKPLARFTT